MQLTFSFSSWHIEASEGILGRQYDNLAHQIVVVGSLPEGYSWDMLVECRGNYNTIPLTVNATGASAALTADQLALSGYYDFQLRGTQDSVIHHTNSTQVFIPDTIVGPGTWPVLPTEFSQAEAAIKELNAHPPVPGENGYWMLWDLDAHAYVQSDLPIPGLTMQIGDTITGEPGTDALVENVGTPTEPKLQFTIPRGDEGKAATIEVGEVTASDPGSEPQVKNSGTENAAVFDFVLPRGQTGPTGQAATIEVESTVTGEPGTQASVENVGTTGAAKLKFTIPRGDTGQNGATPTLSAGNVETLEPDQPATASVTGEGPAYQINLGIPRGQTGAQGAPGQNGQNGQTPTISVGTVTTLDPGQDATAEITGETPNLTLNLGIPEGQPGQDGVQLNDSAVNTTEAWSSKKIVDTLCPAFNVSGNPVTCNPVEGYPLSAVVTLEPKQAGSGDPSPENVRPISGWDEVTVNVSGKNLLDYSGEIIIPQDIYQYIYSGEEFITALNKLPRNTLLAMSANWSYVSEISVYKRIVLVYDDYTRTSFVDGESATIEDKKIIATWLYNGATKTQDCILSDIQFEYGSTPTPYEPYKTGTTATLTLPETIYGGTVDAVSGVGSNEVDIIALSVADMGNSNESPGWRRQDWIGDYVENTDQDEYFSIAADYVASNADGRKRLRFNAAGTVYFIENDLGLTQAQLKEQYPDLVFQFAFRRLSPEPFQATGNQPIPALAGENTVYTDGDSVSVSGRKDPLSTIQTMQAQITALQDQITQGGTA